MAVSDRSGGKALIPFLFVLLVVATWVATWVAIGCRGKDRAIPPTPRPSPAEREAAAAAFDRYRRPDLLIAALGLHGGERVADLGAGRGYLTFRLAEAVGKSGLLVATDVDAAALAELRERVEKTAAAPRARIEVRQVPLDDPGLADERYDLILMSEVDQYLPDRTAYLRRLTAHLGPTGRLVVCNRQAYRQPVLSAARAAGLLLKGEDRSLPAHFLLFFGAHP